MSASDRTFRPPNDDIVWDTLATVMGVPQHNRKYFICWLMDSAENEWGRAAKPPEIAANWSIGRRAEIDANVAKTGRAFIRAIERRNREGHATSSSSRISTRHLGAVDLRHATRQVGSSTSYVWKVDFAGMRTLATSSADGMMKRSVDEYLQRVESPKRGAPKRADRFAEFLEHTLCRAIALEGCVSFNRKTGKGNVVDLLDKLRPLMPTAFIPTVLPMPLIERLSGIAHRVRDDIASDPAFAQAAYTIAMYEQGSATSSSSAIIRHRFFAGD